MGESKQDDVTAHAEAVEADATLATRQALPRVYLRKGRVKPLVFRHPWVFADSVARVEGNPQSGAAIEVRAPDGRFLAQGFYSPASRLRVRAFSFQKGDVPDDRWLQTRLEQAIRFRQDVLGLPNEETDAVRLVNSDADGIPGLVVDRLGPVLAIQIQTAGLDVRRAAVLNALEALLEPEAIVSIPDAAIREKEGLAQPAFLQRGALPEDESVVVREHGIRFFVDLARGQKTGFFCDQRENRHRVGQLAAGRRVLDAFCYTGGFAPHAARGGAERVDALDSSQPALALAKRNAAQNGLVVGFGRADVFKQLAAWRAEGRRFDLVVLDPPKYARSRRDLDAALRKYAALFGLGVSVTAPDGILDCCSCSGLVDGRRLHEVLRDVARRAERSIRVFHRGEQAPDHPVSIACPEGRYLQAWFCHVT